jgi:hypothetical protein
MTLNPIPAINSALDGAPLAMDIETAPSRDWCHGPGDPSG